MAVGQQAVRIVGSVLVRNEDVFVERAVRNAAAFCDRIHAVDHLSTDGTWEILRGLAAEYDHLDVRRASHAAESHRVLEQYVGAPTWVIGVDGDELFDPAGLARLRADLLAGVHGDVFKLKGHVLNCTALRLDEQEAEGYMSPPSRPMTKLFNLAAVDRWTGSPERLHSGTVSFRHGFEWESQRTLYDDAGWDDDPLRCLHVCFLRRSSAEPPQAAQPRRSLGETGVYRRGALGTLARIVRRPVLDQAVREVHDRGSTWKLEKYRRGALVVKDASPFLGAP